MGSGIILAVVIAAAVLILLATAGAWLWAIAPSGKKVDFREFQKYDYAHRGLHRCRKIPVPLFPWQCWGALAWNLICSLQKTSR